MTTFSNPAPPLIERWRAMATKASGGKDPEALTARLGALSLPALCWERPEPSLPSGRVGPWEPRQPLASPDRSEIAELYERFVAPLLLAEPSCLAGDPSAVPDPAWLEAILPEGALGMPVAIQAGASAGAVLGAALAVAEQRGLARSEVWLTVQGDPLGALAELGGLSVPAERALADLAEPARVASELPHVHVLAPSGAWAGRAGAEPAVQIAVALCGFLDMVRALEPEGLSVGQVAAATELELALRGDVLLDLAAVRALRHLMVRVLIASGAAESSVRIYASLPSTELSSVDTTTNLLRLSAAGFAGAASGADALGLPPHDLATAAPQAAARRLSANLHLLLARESRLGRVQDPASGSYAVESLTRTLAQAAWTELRLIESEGGLLASLRAGFLQERIAEARRERQSRVARRGEPWVGVSQFVDPTAPLPEPASAPPAARQLVERVRAAPPWRPAGGWEALQRRLRPRQISVMLLQLGPLARHKARSDFARDVLTAAGFGVHDSGPIIDPDAGAVAFATHGAPIACICGSDDDYERLAPTLATHLVAAGARAVVLAGRVPEPPEPFTSAGIRHAVYRGADVLSVLRELADLLESP
ncbi:MAG: hypothetical protein EA397_13035 [Deltaproteobacteria bacterium]|nr:MAG: hypothetical protein EA397_13035 [Deltaproteobacteria bacterium]